MKVLFAIHGWPPELVGGTELCAQALARALARSGHEVVVAAGSIRPSGEDGVRVEETEEELGGGARIRVLRLHRGDLYFDHWHKSRSPAVARAFRAILRAERPDLVHVHHWIRLSRDLAAAAAREGLPAVVSLHDLWTSCPIAFRLLPDTGAFCTAPVGPHPCIACAGKVPPRTPWVPTEAAFLALAERQRELARELELARVIVAPSRAHARALERFLGRDAGPLGERELEVVAPVLAHRHEARTGIPASPASTGRLALGAWGRLAAHKGSELLLEALELLPPEAPVELHFAGAAETPELEERLRAKARQLSGATVRFHGPYDPAELARHPASAVHAFVSATRAHESYGLVLDEARLLGLPAVVPGTEAFAERAPAGSGVLLFEPENPASLAAALARLVREPRLWPQLAAEARAQRARVPRAEECAERHLSLYARALASGAPPIAEEEWFEARMGEAAIAEWDRALAARSAEELGLAPASASRSER